MGVLNVDTLHIENRNDSNDEENLKRLEEANCIFFTGGDQLKITSLIEELQLKNLLKKHI